MITNNEINSLTTVGKIAILCFCMLLGSVFALVGGILYMSSEPGEAHRSIGYVCWIFTVILYITAKRVGDSKDEDSTADPAQEREHNEVFAESLVESSRWNPIARHVLKSIDKD